ncbi:MAG: trypsin-like peptidase domain-containing protein [Dehalococcoidales bacterium]|nr:trypsin-like peptidase domain-containing protein [Dehalococcoidales bacterium]
MKTILRYLTVLLLLVVVMTAASGCVYINLGSTPTPTLTTTPGPIDTGFVVPSTVSSKSVPVIPDFVSVVADVRPSVVAINTRIPGMDIFGSSLLQEGAGSGWIIDQSGIIVTNNHVVEGAGSINVTLDDGRNFAADLVRTDAISDLAVIRINALDLQAAKTGDSSRLRAGDWVVTIGNSLGQGISVTKGIVSALGVSLSVGAGETLYDLIQTDAAINPGNSGGPLVNLLGEVIGITSVKVAEVGVEGTGFAISTREALPIIEDLVKVGYIIRPWMGMSLYTVDQIVILRYRLAVDKGAMVTRIAADSPADKAGITAGDVITAIDDREVASAEDLNRIIRECNIGQEIQVSYYRGSVKNRVSLVLIASPPPG